MEVALKAPGKLAFAVAGLDAWLDSMRGPLGYGGPVAHWWQQSLIYTGAGLDWRYEGIIIGYLNLWQRTSDECWLSKACRAGNDLVRGQLNSGHFAASSFEINPASAGTPHEAACDIALLSLALALKKAEKDGWQAYAAAARRNLVEFYITQLWNEEKKLFRDSPNSDSFVPNKAASASEAFFLLAELSQEAEWAERFALPNLKGVINHQKKDGKLVGAISQNSINGTQIEKYFPIYNARCLPVLVKAYRWTGNEEYAQSALLAMKFISAFVRSNGSLPTVIYPNCKTNNNPAWVAPLAEILRAAQELEAFGFEADLAAVKDRLFNGQDQSGGFQTATGFAAQGGRKLSGLPDFRDLLHVAGWCDKVFRYLTIQVGSEKIPACKDQTFQADCTFMGRRLRLIETNRLLEVFYENGTTAYRWQKGADWAEIASEEFWLR